MSLLASLISIFFSLFIIRQLLVWLILRLLDLFSWLRQTKLIHWLKQTKLVSAIIKFWDALPFLHPNCSDLVQFWRNLRNFIRKLVINLIIGLSFTWILLTFLYDIPFLREQEDQDMDLVMQLNQEIIPSFQKNHIPHFVFLDIDDETHQNWGEPLFTPRNKVKELIATAVKAEAKLVIVDIDLSRETSTEGLELSKPPTPIIAGLELPKYPCDQELHDHLDNATACKLSKHPYDQELYDYLDNYAATCKKKANKSPCPPIILVRTFSEPPNYSLSTWDVITKEIPPLPVLTPRSSFLDELVEHSAPYIQWGSVLFLPSQADQIVRRWWLWQPICVQQQLRVIPSIELLATALIRNSSFQHWNNVLIKSANCSSGYFSSQLSKRAQLDKQIKIDNNLIINLDDTLLGIRQRLMYKIPWKAEVKDEDEKYILRIFPAQDYKKRQTYLKNTIVVIGGSYPESGDIHLTPIGEMPGAMVIINAIHSLLQYGTIEPLTTKWKLLLQTGLIILVNVLSLGFEYLIIKRLRSYSNTLFTFSLNSGASIILMLPISIILLNYGIWLDLVIPLMFIQVNQHMAIK